MAGLAGLKRLRPRLVGDPVRCQGPGDLPPSSSGLVLASLELVGQRGEERLGLLLLSAGVAILLDWMFRLVALRGHSNKETVLTEVIIEAPQTLIPRIRQKY